MVDVKMVQVNRSLTYLSLGCMIIVLAFLAAPVSGVMGAAMKARDLSGTNMEGIDHWNTFVNSAQECSDLCDNTAGCAGAVYVLPNTVQGPNGHCWRKSAVTGDTEDFNCISFKKLTGIPPGGCTETLPQLKYSISPEWGFAPLTVHFTDQSTGAKKWSWVFGDGTGAGSTEQNAVYTYTVGSPEGKGYMGTHGVEGACSSPSGVFFTVRVYDNAGLLEVTSNPAGAKIILDGKTLSGTTPFTTDEPLPTGKYSVVVKLDGYTDYSTTVTIENAQTRKVYADLVKIGSETTTVTTGSLQITTTPDGAAVYVDGGSQGTSPKTIAGLAAGSHTIKLTKAGYTDYQGTVTVTSGQTTPLNVKLVAGQGTPTASKTATPAPSPSGTVSLPVSPLPSGPGTLTVRSTPAGANVYIDGEKVGTTPAQVRNVTPGSHKLLLTLQGYGDISQTIDVTGGSDKEVSVDFSTGKKAPGFAVPVSLAALALVSLVLLGRKKR